MTPNTAMADALRRSGFNTNISRLYQIAIDILRAEMRTKDRGFSKFRRAVQDDPDLVGQALLFYFEQIHTDMSGVGHAAVADKGQVVHVDARHPNGDGGQGKADIRGAHAAQPANGEDRVNVDKHTRAHPVRESTPAQLAAAEVVRNRIASTILDRVKTSDGRPWGNVGAHELDGMARDGSMAKSIKAKLGTLSNAQRFQTLRELMSPQLFEAALVQAKGESHAS